MPRFFNHSCLRCSCGQPISTLSWAIIRLRNTYRSVLGLMIDVHERSCDTRECFELILQSLANIVRLPQGCLCVHDNINFDEVIRSALHRVCKVSCSLSSVQQSIDCDVRDTRARYRAAGFPAQRWRPCRLQVAGIRVGRLYPPRG